MVAALTGLGVIAAGFVAIPSEGNAGVTATSAAERVSGAFSLLADTHNDSAVPQAAGGTGSAVRMVTIGYHTDSTAALLIRKPGAQH